LLGLFIKKSNKIIEEATENIKKAVNALEPPKVLQLNRKSLLNICAAVAVDAGQTLFNGVFRDIGIVVYQVASSKEEDPPSPYAFWASPSLPDDERKNVICGQMDKLQTEDKMIAEFVKEIGWRVIHQDGVMPDSCFRSASAFSNFIRDLLEWSRLFEIGKELKDFAKKKLGIQPVLLRDGTLRFANLGEGQTKGLRKIFQGLDIPILGITKKSALLRNPVIYYWLRKHKVFATKGPFLVSIKTEMFEELGWRLERYFGDEGIRFGRYAIVRFDPMPGSRNIFAVDVPDYLESDIDNVLVFLSGVARQATATAYPIPGYPIALKKAHDRAVLSEDRVSLLESSFRRTLPPEVFELLKGLSLF